MRRLLPLLALMGACLLASAGSALAKRAAPGPGYTLIGTATLVSPGNLSATAVGMTSDPGTYGAIGFAVAPGLKLSDVNDLASDYQLVNSNCWDGSPRFTLGVAKGGGATREIYFYFGRQADGTFNCPSSYANTGNLAAPTGIVDTSNLPGGSQADTYAAAQGRYGAYAIRYIAIDFDGGVGGSQAADFDNTQVNGTLYTYEP
jgi:hypothetical protein